MLRLLPEPPAFYPGGEIIFRGSGMKPVDLLHASKKTLRKLRGDRISMIFQDPMSSLNPYLTVGRQLTEVLEVHRGQGRAAARDAAIEMLSRVGIPEPRRRFGAYPHEFSGGMRQRVMIAMALLCEPELLIADEPTTALDVTIQAQILDLLADLRRDHRTSIVLITHDLGVVAGMADHIAVMYAGRIVERGPTDAVFRSPKHPYTRGLLASVPRVDEHAHEQLRPIPGLPPDLSDLPGGCPFAPRCSEREHGCSGEYPATVTFSGHGRDQHQAACRRAGHTAKAVSDLVAAVSA